MLNSVSVDPHEVEAALNELEPVDKRSAHIMSLYDSIHSLTSRHIEKLVLVAKVRARLDAWRGGATPNQCPTPGKRCWVCNRCYGLACQSTAKIRMQIEEFQTHLVEVLLEVEIESDLIFAICESGPPRPNGPAC